MTEWMNCWNTNCSNTTLSKRAVFCPECKTERPRNSQPFNSIRELSDLAKAALQAQESSRQSGHPNSYDLTEQQWFNVCKFFPTVAARCKRPQTDLSPDNPMHKVRPGPLLQSMLGRTPVVERQPGEEG